jgi:hypothetical protein
MASEIRACKVLIGHGAADAGGGCRRDEHPQITCAIRRAEPGACVDMCGSARRGDRRAGKRLEFAGWPRVGSAVRDRAGTPVPARPLRSFGADESGGGWWCSASGVGGNRSAAPNTALQPDAPARADFGRCSKIGVVLVSQPFAPARG